MYEYEAVIRLNPRTKKNHQRIVVNRKTGRPFVMQSEDYTQYEKDAGWFLQHIPDKPIDYPVNVKYKFYKQNNVRCDLSNLIAAADDILVKYGILADDNFHIIRGHDGSRVYVDKNYPRTEIFITKEKENE